MFENKKDVLEDCLKFQEHLVGRAKELFNEKKSIVPVSFVVSRKMEIPPEVRSWLVDPDSFAKVTDDEVAADPGGIACLLVPNTYSNEMLLSMVPLVMKGSTDIQASIESMRVAAASIFNLKDKEEIDAKVVDGLCKVVKAKPKEIFAAYLRYLCKKTSAVAFLKIDEAYVRAATVATLQLAGMEIEDGADISKVEIPSHIMERIPRKDAILVYLETGKLRKSTILTFEPSKDESGTLLWDRQDQVDEGRKDFTLTGLFTGMIRPSEDSTNTVA